MSKEMNIYCDSVRTALESIPEELFAFTDKELERKVNPSMKMYQLKRAFWKEFERCEKAGRKMKNVNVYRGIVAQRAWQRVMEHPMKIAWLSRPLDTYESISGAALAINSKPS